MRDPYRETPPARTTRHDVTTPAGRVAVWDRPGAGRPIVLLHGNTSSKSAFRALFEAARLASFRLVAIDLPGSGESADAGDPERDYTIPAFARTIAAVIAALGLERPVLVGWSLGGHIGIEAAAQGLDLAALVLTGTPPAGPGGAEIAATFRAGEVLAVGFSESPTPAALDRYVDHLYGDTRPIAAELRAAARRCDGRMRRLFAEHWLSGSDGTPQRAFVAAWPRPIAVVQGDAEPFFDPAVLDDLAWGNLWRGAGQIVAGTGHAPFYERPDAYAALLADFAATIDAAEPG